MKTVLKVLGKIVKWYLIYDVACIIVVGTGYILNEEADVMDEMRAGEIDIHTIGELYDEALGNRVWKKALNGYKRLFK